jgi:threonine dehydratase
MEVELRTNGKIDSNELPPRWAGGFYLPEISAVQSAQLNLKSVVKPTPLQFNAYYSELFGANIYFKREDLQVVRSYKIRGAYNKISSLSPEEALRGIVCASAGNHAQGVAFACATLGIKGTIFMPVTTPAQKINRVKNFGKDKIELVLVGDTFDEAFQNAQKFCQEQQSIFIHPFDDAKVIEGQATVGLEILQSADNQIDYLFLPVGGGGLSSGVSAVFKALSPHTQIIGVEPTGAPAMYESLKAGEIVTLEKIDTFADGVAVKKVGQLNFEICKNLLREVALVPEGKICEVMLELYDKDAIVAEPAGALSIGALSQYKDEIKGKNVVCVVSGGNNDITRTEEIRKRALLYQNLKHYFIIKFPQRAGALKEFVTQILGPNDDIVHFEYVKKNNQEKGPALIGIELKNPSDLEPLLERIKAHNFMGEYLNEKLDLFDFLV